MSLQILALHNVYREAGPGTGGGDNGGGDEGGGTVGVSDPFVAPAWTRPSEWIAAPNISEALETIALVVSVVPGLSLVSFQVSGSFSVNWGDGATEQYSAGDVAWHEYDFSTLAAAPNVWGYKQTTITITPQAGQTLTSIDFSAATTHPLQASMPERDSRIMEMHFNTPNLTSLVVADWANPARTGLVSFGLLSVLKIHRSQVASLAGQFARSVNLRAVSISNSPTITSMARAFEMCATLVKVEHLDTTATTDMTRAFFHCRTLHSLPSLSTSLVTSFEDTFGACASLRVIPSINTSSATTMKGMFAHCSSLRTLPEMNTSSVTDFSWMFYCCPLIKETPQFNTANGQNFRAMYAGCAILQRLHPMSFVSATSTSDMFGACMTLYEIPEITLPLGCLYSGMFYGCKSLTHLVLNVTVTSAEEFASAVFNCHALISLKGPTFNLPANAYTLDPYFFQIPKDDQGLYGGVFPGTPTPADVFPVLGHYTPEVKAFEELRDSSYEIPSDRGRQYSLVLGSNIHSVVHMAPSLTSIELEGMTQDFSMRGTRMTIQGVHTLCNSLPTIPPGSATAHLPFSWIERDEIMEEFEGEWYTNEVPRQVPLHVIIAIQKGWSVDMGDFAYITTESGYTFFDPYA